MVRSFCHSVLWKMWQFELCSFFILFLGKALNILYSTKAGLENEPKMFWSWIRITLPFPTLSHRTKSWVDASGPNDRGCHARQLARVQSWHAWPNIIAQLSLEIGVDTDDTGAMVVWFIGGILPHCLWLHFFSCQAFQHCASLWDSLEQQLPGTSLNRPNH